MEIEEIKKNKNIAEVIGSNFFYKIKFKKPLSKLPKTLHNLKLCRIFVDDVSFLTDGDKVIYILLPLYLEPNYVKGKLSKVLNFI